MGRVNDDQWLDKALNQALHADDTRPDFQKWIADHPSRRASPQPGFLLAPPTQPRGNLLVATR